MTGNNVSPPRLEIMAIGHSTRSLDAFIQLLESCGIKLLADVRTIPRSRRNPQFNYDTLGEALYHHGITYLPMKGLGGLRHARADSRNTAWENASFRGYADYMQTAEFGEALQQLIDAARDRVTAIMCAEAVPWRCHRSLIADALTVRGITVRHIIHTANTTIHTLNSMARVEGTRITYPGEQALM